MLKYDWMRSIHWLSVDDEAKSIKIHYQYFTEKLDGPAFLIILRIRNASIVKRLDFQIKKAQIDWSSIRVLH